ERDKSARALRAHHLRARPISPRSAYVAKQTPREVAARESLDDPGRVRATAVVHAHRMMNA
ncbi:MAG TPA: hypothetical protein VMF89_30770, partial [Polyangiales bacterium]|nr:hypothetical protein [Polyangiales bacterium]